MELYNQFKYNEKNLHISTQDRVYVHKKNFAQKKQKYGPI